MLINLQDMLQYAAEKKIGPLYNEIEQLIKK